MKLHTGVGRLRRVNCERRGRLAVLVSIFLLVPVTLIAGDLAMTCEATSTSPIVTISIPSEKLLTRLPEGRRIRAYRSKISSGRLCGIVKVALDWWITIQPETEPYQIDAGAGHGASWLTIHDIRKGAFERFMTVQGEKDSPAKLEIEFKVDVPAEDDPEYFRLNEKDVLMLPSK